MKSISPIQPIAILSRFVPCRRFILAVAILTGAHFATQTLAGAAERPNILLIVVDDLGPEWLSCYGSQEIETPRIDRLAETGMRFTNAYSMPKCTPTRATLLTGRYPFRHGWVDHWDVPRWGAGCHFDPKHNVTFARILKGAGYVTAAAGKWQINDFRVQPEIMGQHGFDEWCMWTGYETGNPPSARRYWNPYIHTPNGSRTYEDRFGPAVFVDFLVDFMKRNVDRPMLLYFPMVLTHLPLTTTPLEPDVAGKLPRFKAMVGYVDHAVGRLVSTLDELKIRDRTIIFFTTDNGTAGGITARMNGRTISGGKGKLTENGICAPFIVNGPTRVPAGVVTGALTDFTDLLPTFADLAGASVPADLEIDGRSIADLILGNARDSSREWIMAMGGGTARLRNSRVVPDAKYADRVVRDKRYKLHVQDGQGTKLFDLQADPEEKTNLIDSSDPRVLAARKRLEAVVRTFPPADAAPRYDPTPPQPWDKKPAKR